MPGAWAEYTSQNNIPPCGIIIWSAKIHPQGGDIVSPKQAIPPRGQSLQPDSDSLNTPHPESASLAMQSNSILFYHYTQSHEIT